MTCYDYIFRRGMEDFVINNLKRPTDCVISAWVVAKMAATSGQNFRIDDKEIITYRGVRLIPSMGNEEMYFFIKQ